MSDALQELNVSGTWESTWAELLSTIELSQISPDYVVGTYLSHPQGDVYFAGALAGELNGRVFRGRWTDSKTTGRFALEFSADGQTFSGTWGLTVMSDSDGGAWTGHRL